MDITVMKTSDGDASKAGTVWRSLQWWPTLAAVGLASFVAFNMSKGSELAPVVVASGLVHVAAAAMKKPSMAWPMFFATCVVISVNEEHRFQWQGGPL